MMCICHYLSVGTPIAKCVTNNYYIKDFLKLTFEIIQPLFLRQENIYQYSLCSYILHLFLNGFMHTYIQTYSIIGY